MGQSELYNIADLVVENKLLIDKFDQLIGKQEQVSDPTARSNIDDELSELSQSFID